MYNFGFKRCYRVQMNDVAYVSLVAITRRSLQLCIIQSTTQTFTFIQKKIHLLVYIDFYMSAGGQTFCVHADNARSNWPVATSFLCTCTTFSRKWTLHLLYWTNMQQQECQQRYGFSLLAMYYFSYRQAICMFFDWGIKNDHNIFIISMYQKLRKHVKFEVLTSPIIILKPVRLPMKILFWSRMFFVFSF